MNIILDCDSYKSSHYLQYPPNTESMFSYVESRGGKWPETVFFGLQYFLKSFLSQTVTVADVEEAREVLTAHGEPFPYEGWMYIATKLRGKLPVRIRAVPEGTVVPTGNVLVSIESTDPKVFWVASWLETALLRAVWYPTTVCTQSYNIKKTIMGFLEKTSSAPAEEISFKLHDFGARGVSSSESSGIGGLAHLVNFQGTDTVQALLYGRKYYGIDMAGFSIPASEHSSITSWGRENEVEAYRNLLQQFGQQGKIFACVSDSYDLLSACEHLWGGELKDEVIDSGATVVIRPDSGDPATMVLKTLQVLESKFGSTTNDKGYRVLNHVRVIQGDGINQDSITEILNLATEHGFSATNIAFGMGGALLQGINRDTQRFAMKCSSITVDGKHVDVVKDPITDPGKRSKAGRIDLILTEEGLKTVRIGGQEVSHPESVMRTVYRNGEILLTEGFATIRARAK